MPRLSWLLDVGQLVTVCVGSLKLSDRQLYTPSEALVVLSSGYCVGRKRQ